MAAASDRRGIAAMTANLNIGCYISLITEADIRYEGYLRFLGPYGQQVGLQNVKCFGTEGRRQKGPQVSANDNIFEYIFFRGSDIMDLQVISSPSPQSTSFVPEDPAIIQSHGAAKAANFSTSAQPVLSATPFQLNQPLDTAAPSCSFWGSFLPPPPTNISYLAVPNYLPVLVGSSGRVSRFPPPPQSLVMASQPPVQQAKNQNVNTSVAGGSRLSEHHCPLLLRRSTGSPNTLPPLLPSPSVQSNPGQFAKLVSNLSSTPKPIDGSSALSSVPVDPSPKSASSLPEVLNVDATPAPVTDEKNSDEVTGVSFSKKSKLSPMTIEEQSGPRQSSPSQSLQTTNIDAMTALAPVTESPPSDSTTKTLQGSTSSHRYKGQSARGRDQVHRSLPWHRGHLLGRANVANGVALNTHQSSRNHAVGRGDGEGTYVVLFFPFQLVGAALLPHQRKRLQPKGVLLHNPGDAGNHFLGRGAKNPHAIRRFKEDFDFEAMNEKFNKKEVWDFFSKNSKAEADEGNEDDKKMDDDDVKGKAKEVPVKDNSKPVYCEDDFFDHLSYGAPDESDQVTLSEQRKIDDETFGVEIPILQQDHGQGSHSAGASQTSSGGRAHGNMRGSRGRGRNVRGHVHLK